MDRVETIFFRKNVLLLTSAGNENPAERTFPPPTGITLL